MADQPQCTLNRTASEAMASWRQQVSQGALEPFEAAQQIVRRLGAHFNEAGDCHLGFWAPELAHLSESPGQVYLEVFTPLESVDFRASQQSLQTRVEHLPVVLDGEYCWAVIRGIAAGQRNLCGAFYWLKYQDQQGQWHTLRDPLAHSLPFGASSPAEAYDMATLHAGRPDLDYFESVSGKAGKDDLVTQTAPTNILQLHPGTSTAAGTLEGLTAHYQALAEKMTTNQALEPAETAWLGYDAVQLMPIEPTIEFEAGSDFWQCDGDQPGERLLNVKAPDMTNWGYDVMTLGSPAVAATVLGSKRPDELVDLIATLHTFPGKPIRVIFDIVYGHTDNQVPQYLSEIYFAGDNMYGKNLNYRHPMVRAMLLEMQRRKSNYGVDGVRVDGAQDFKIWDPVTEQLYHDDDYLQCMSDLPVEVGNHRYRPWMIFEDGRPWPRDDWELSSTYREVTRQQPDIVQWGPLTFAHNTPYLFTFWLSKWWRVREIAEVGSHWITGCANHDTLRRGTQVDPKEPINTYLGDSLPAIFRRAYNNPASHLLDYAMLPGIPMEFINANVGAPWSFMRNIDDRYGVKVMAEEAWFTHWAIRPEDYQHETHFQRIKQRGFDELPKLQRFLHTLMAFVDVTGYDLDAMTQLIRATGNASAHGVDSIAGLKAIARDWMDDVHDYCNVSHWQAALDPAQSGYFRQLREFRRERPALRNNLNLSQGDYFDYLHPSEGAVIFVGLRHLPERGEQLLFIANMAGAPRDVTPQSLPIPGLSSEGWDVALLTPGLTHADFGGPLFLSDSEGVVFRRNARA
ncbi:MAG: glucosylglycerol hydrolase [Saccharospirillum sp.]